MEADCDTNHYLVMAKVRERLAVSKQRMHSLHMETFNLKTLNELENKEKCRDEPQIEFQRLKISTLRWKLTVLGKGLEKISKFQPRSD
jgi:hypothetical protein